MVNSAKKNVNNVDMNDCDRDAPLPEPIEHPGAAGSEPKPDEPAPELTIAAPPEQATSPDNAKYLRLLADFENFRRRVNRERDEVYRRANEDLMTEILPALDNLEMAMKAVKGDLSANPIAAGFKIVADQLTQTLIRFGLNPIDAENVPFDPSVHEAVTQIPSEAPANTVVAQIRRGYRLGSRLLRPVQVVLSANTADSLPAQDTTVPPPTSTTPTEQTTRQ